MVKQADQDSRMPKKQLILFGIAFLIFFLMIFVFLASRKMKIFFTPKLMEPGTYVEPKDSQATDEGVDSLAEANNRFGLELYNQLSQQEKGNLFISPYSISTALAMTYEGAKGKTATEMEKVFYFPKDSSIRQSCFAKIYKQLNQPNDDYQLNTANALWAQKDYPFLDEYFKTIEEYYGGKVTNLDFVNQAEKSRQTINSWVEDQTNNKIKDLVAKNQINDLTRLVLTNAIYFKGTWVYQFEKKQTREMDFQVNPQKTVKIPMMYLKNEEALFNYAKTDDLQLLELPYEGDQISMLIILPKKDLESIQKDLDSEKLAEYRKMLEEEKVTIYLPRFTFKTKYLLNDSLMKLGMPTALTPAADFSGMTGKKDLFIDFIVHQAFVDVNEEGTEATAATAVGMVLKAVIDENIFRADHPFIFLIVQKQSGNVLFLGRVVDPS